MRDNSSIALNLQPAADWEIGDTAGLETCATATAESQIDFEVWIFRTVRGDFASLK
jgi:hypothetical protein